jgi:hypothetical protein
VDVLDDRLLRVRLASLDDAEQHLLGALVESGARVISVEPSLPTLEEVFLEVTR